MIGKYFAHDRREISPARSRSPSQTTRGRFLTDSESIQPDSESIQPDSESIQPDSESIQPDSESIQPDSESIQPDSESITNRLGVARGRGAVPRPQRTPTRQAACGTRYRRGADQQRPRQRNGRRIGGTARPAPR